MALRQLRKRLGMSQSQLADLIGGRTNFLAVSRWERGKIAPNQWRCRKLAEIAQQAGRRDLAGLFKLDFDKWRTVADDDTMAILQIGAAMFRTEGVVTEDLEFSEKLDTLAETISHYLLDNFLNWDLTGQSLPILGSVFE